MSDAVTSAAAAKLREIDPSPDAAVAPLQRNVFVQRAELRRQEHDAAVAVDQLDDEQVAPNLPPIFWDARRSLSMIRDAAHSTARSADAVLGAVLARIVAMTPPTVELPTPVGVQGSLNLFVVMVGPSGAGKSGANAVAAQMLPIDPLRDDVAVMPLGSGEGLTEAFFATVEEIDEKGKTRRVKRQVRTAVLFELDEGQALAQQGGRQGSTLLPTVRNAWSGGRVGQANASEERTRHLAPGEYRAVFVLGIQTEHAIAIIDESAGGTTQRVWWVAATDPTIPDIGPSWPGAMSWQPPQHQAGPMGLDQDIAAEIRRAALARSRGEVVVDPLDAHRDLVRLKVAAALAVLEERTSVDAEDWHLAGTVLDASDRVRAGIIDTAKRRAAEAEAAQTRRAVRRLAAVADDETQRAHDVMASAIARHVHRQKCDGGCKRRCVTQSTPGKYRAIVSVDEAIDDAVSRGWITVDGGTFRPGSSRPS